MVAALCLVAGAGAGVAAAAAPLQGTDAPDAIAGQYIVVLQDTATPAARQRVLATARSNGATILEEYTAALKGFAASMSPAAIAAVLQDSAVAFAEADGPVDAFQTQQLNAPWGLDRIDQRNLPLNGIFTYFFSINCCGWGIPTFIMDSGIFADQFGGLAGNSYNAIDETQWSNDCRGHGTAVAGVAGHATYGVAKLKLMQMAVKVMPCSGPGLVSTLIDAVDWLTDQHDANQETFIANMSIGARNASTALDKAVAASIADDIIYVVAAGNDTGRNACTRSPQRVPAAIVVGATDRFDRVAPYSNTGPCVDVFAPGTSITSMSHTTVDATTTSTGTSVAAPFVAGTAALYLEFNPMATPAEVVQWITGNATPGVITGLNASTQNRLLYAPLPFAKK